MNQEVARKLCALNNEFYRVQAASFSDSRHAGWPGWQQVLALAAPAFEHSAKVIDMACGNLRFEKYLAARLGLAGLANDLPKQKGKGSSGADSQNEGEALGMGMCMRPVTVHALALDACDDLVPDVCAGIPVEKHLSQGVSPTDQMPCHFNGQPQDPPQTNVNNPTFSVTYHHCDVMEEFASGSYGNWLAVASGAACSEGEELGENALSGTGATQGEDTAQRESESMAQRENESELADLTVCFGFMHHVPLPEWQQALMRHLVAMTKSRGFVAISFWRFMDNAKLAEKACKTTSQGLVDLKGRLGISAEDLNEGDYLLGWRNTPGNQPGAYRYCHSFSDGEIAALIDSVSAQADCVARFRADGADKRLNDYVVLRVR